MTTPEPFDRMESLLVSPSETSILIRRLPDRRHASEYMKLANEDDRIQYYRQPRNLRDGSR